MGALWLVFQSSMFKVKMCLPSLVNDNRMDIRSDTGNTLDHVWHICYECKVDMATFDLTCGADDM